MIYYTSAAIILMVIVAICGLLWANRLADDVDPWDDEDLGT